MVKQQKNIPLISAVLICIISLAIMIFALVKSSKTTQQLSFTPPPFEVNAVYGIPDVPEGLGWGEVDTQVYKASVCGVIILDENTADVWFTNPENNSVWLKLRVLDSKGSILGETGLIKPGEFVQTITFIEKPKIGDTIGLKLMAYEPETYHSIGSATLTTTVTGESK